MRSRIRSRAASAGSTRVEETLGDAQVNSGELPAEVSQDRASEPPVPEDSPRDGSASERADSSQDDVTLTESGPQTIGAVATIGPAQPTGDVAGEWRDGLVVAGRFRIVRFISQGGMGRVYQAHDEMLDRPIALKRIPEAILFDGDARDDLRQEANRLLDLAHDNIVRVHTYYDGPTWPFIAMEYLSGPTLKQLLRARKQYGRAFSVDEITTIARQVASGLAHAHAKGIVHRDLKPSNLMLAAVSGDEIRPEDLVKITDFGISRVIADGTMRQTGRRTGTLPYMSPEQFRGEVSTATSDIYSFACTLYELLAGRPPFYTGDIGYQILNVAPKPIDSAPRAINNTILRGLAKDAKERFESAEHLLEGLEGKVVVTRPPIHRARRARWLKVAVGAAVVLTGFLLGRISQSPAPSPPPSTASGNATSVRSEDLPEFNTFRDRVLQRLESEIPSSVGRSDTLAPTPDSPVVALRFSLLEPTDSAYQRELFAELSFSCFRLDDDTTLRRIERKDTDGEAVFTILELSGGRYGLQPHVTWPGATTPEPLFPTRSFQFEVDLTAPSLEVSVPTSSPVLGGAGTAGDERGIPTWSTFARDLEVRLDATEQIESAVYARVDSTEPTWQPIPDVTFWKLELDEGKNEFKLAAFDRAGNRSREASFVVFRRRLGLRQFGLAAPPAGNRAKVRGTLVVEGTELPRISYTLGGQPVEVADASIMPSSEPSGGAFLHEFSAVIELPEPTANAIEVKYALGEAPPRAFDGPSASRLKVDVEAPALEWIREVPSRTRETTLELYGRITPYFEGLTVRLDESQLDSRVVVPIPSATDDTATIHELLALDENEDHALEVRFLYHGVPLTSSPIVLSSYCDTRPPLLVEPPEFSDDGNWMLWMTLRPSEELRLLRIVALTSVGEPAGRWHTVAPDLFSLLTYRYQIPVPEVRTQYRIEMTDLAGNTHSTDEACAWTREALAFRARTSDLSLGGARPDEVAAAPAITDGEGDVRRSTHSLPGDALLLRSPFVERIGLEFRTVSADRIDLATTEVSESVWAEFLRQTGRDGEASGEREVPKLLSFEDTQLLSDFVRWFEENARDGYAYRLPTPVEWMCAFVAASDPDEARHKIYDWFVGNPNDARYPQQFNEAPRARYGVNRIDPSQARPENKTPSGLYDMEANAQEVVQASGQWLVIGGFNQLEHKSEFARACTEARRFVEAEQRSRLVGFRLLRFPRSAR